MPRACPLRAVRGRSSTGRAPALQAGGRRFESDRLHQPDRGGGGASARNARAARVAEKSVIRPCPSSPRGGWCGRWVPRGTGRSILFCVRVNQVLVRLWTQAVASLTGKQHLRVPAARGRMGSEALCVLSARPVAQGCPPQGVDGSCAGRAGPGRKTGPGISSARRAFGGCLGTRRR